MIKQHKVLAMVMGIAILAVAAMSIMMKDLRTSAAQRERARQASTLPKTADTSWTKKARSEGAIVQDDASSSPERSDAGQTQGSNDSKYAGNAQSNTITMDDFRSSDEMAYRLIAFYGLGKGDANWQQLKRSATSGITMTRQQADTPVFTVKANAGTSVKAYYRYVMTSSDNQSQSRPLSFSQNDDSAYRATIADVLAYANDNGGRAAVQKMSFKLVN
ncbi:hypothetical protein G6R29_06180 [Fructobacillus sp. M2-14]|uniref:Lipoprotein n=1 Tax=Fructobacillus broussonetiae TaxID=2713173 RepID=A0ABS5R4X0_9LACO|nr:hypothetical protein [Fructobacillus broussonetiae]MBS9339192.1 hypothetical protein [Fructobacillus broussonetiae]